MEIKRKIGISLMMLVIMIVVIIILATVVILSVTKNNAIGNASDAVKEHDRASIQDKVAMVISSIQTKYRCSVKIEAGKINEGIEYELVNSKDKKIEGGIIGWNEEKADETGKDNSYTLEIEMPTYGLYDTTWYIDEQGKVSLKVGDKTFGEIIEDLGEGTRKREESAWNKPYIPSDFHYVEGTVNDGYVIADESGNEFVWIPVDGVNVKYKKHYTPNNNYTDVPDSEYPEGITGATESNIVNSAGGFYIGRYEAGVPEGQNIIDGASKATSNTSGIPVSKKGTVVWTNIDYTNANNNAKAYMNNSEVASGLLTGKSWDTVCKWLQNSGIDVNDSSTYGNYTNSQSLANVDGYGFKQVAGYSEYWKVKNIYDLAGNVAEWTNELLLGWRVIRGGDYSLYGSNNSVCGSYGDSIGLTHIARTFRVQLYIK